jgi:hypothetical protein
MEFPRPCTMIMAQMMGQKGLQLFIDLAVIFAGHIVFPVMFWGLVYGMTLLIRKAGLINCNN